MFVDTGAKSYQAILMPLLSFKYNNIKVCSCKKIQIIYTISQPGRNLQKQNYSFQILVSDWIWFEPEISFVKFPVFFIIKNYHMRYKKARCVQAFQRIKKIINVNFQTLQLLMYLYFIINEN